MQPVISAALSTLEAAQLGEGRYARWLGKESERRDADGATLNPYGCADAANILYTLGLFPANLRERNEWVRTLQEMQDAESGLFHEGTHHTCHVTAHCTAALELFDARPLYPLREWERLDARGELERFLDELDWEKDPWNASHQGAGVYAARVITGEASSEWETRYFAWLWREADGVSGFWRRGTVGATGGETKSGSGTKPLFHHLAGSFHYLFNHEHARRPLRFPEAMIDSCLRIRRENLWPALATVVSFSDIDWVYCLTRAVRQCGHRFGEVHVALHEFAMDYCDFLSGLVRIAEERRTPPFEDMHMLFGALCALAELQTALPGVIRTKNPLRLVLDRRPFI
ncbi:MAG: hypothetical protein LBK99_22470 [Opitutaceae bacterium]|jgi:hypothetical protein|nr:hypothetical protein [Opitutaceae bacterium]